MKQIYYTQCPIGYGLGASNGFQIKRVTEGYPLTSDFRHLGLRAYLPGTRTLAPSSLRFRWGDGGGAEVAYLTPRTHEYETERGLWGRPGGHFAHGVQLDEEALAALAYWPAALYGASFWVATDPAPSREPAPPPLTDDPWLQSTAAAVDRIARVAPALGEAYLASLLTALATVAREGRTLFLVDAPERLAPLIALLTYAFPPPCRRDLTFSTYHDRPEELPGLRLQGTAPAARPNRTVLVSLGIVADVERRAIEPAVASAPWARRIAGWLSRGDAQGRCAVDATLRRGATARGRSACWDGEWLEDLVDVEAALGGIEGGADWPALTRLATWCRREGFEVDWARVHGPSWWREHAASAGDAPLAALVAELSMPVAWEGQDRAAEWGRVFAVCFEGASASARPFALRTVVQAAPVAARAGFVAALIHELTAGLAAQTWNELRSNPECGPALLLPLDVRRAIESQEDGFAARALATRLADALTLPATAAAVLDALAEGVRVRPASGGAVSRMLAEAFEQSGEQGRASFVAWAIGRDDHGDWLAPVLRRAFADPLNIDVWRDIRALVPKSAQARFALVALKVSLEPGLPAPPFRWGVDEVLLPLPADDRPHDTGWPGAYLDRTASDLDLIRWLHVKRDVKPGLKVWLTQARQRGELAPRHEARLDACREYTRVLRTGDARALAETRLPVVPATERGAVLGQIVANVDTTPPAVLDLILSVVREAWPGAFDAGTPGLAGVGLAIGRALITSCRDPVAWLASAARVLETLGLADGGAGFEPDGLLAEVLAATTRSGDEFVAAWSLRHVVLQSDSAWRCLALDVRRDLTDCPVADRPAVLETWDRALDKGLYTGRFFEVWLNACDGPTMAAAVLARAEALKDFDLRWWDHRRHAGACDDLRDAFVRLSPMAPLAADRIVAVEKWLVPAARAAGPPRSRVYDESGLAPLDEPRLSTTRGGAAARLSPPGEDRWACLKALSEFDGNGIEAIGRWGRLLQPGLAERLARLDAGDRYRFLAWLFLVSDEFDEVPVPRLAVWLYRARLSDAVRIQRWHEALAEIIGVPDEARQRRAGLVSAVCEELRRVINDERGRRRIPGVADSP